MLSYGAILDESARLGRFKVLHLTPTSPQQYIVKYSASTDILCDIRKEVKYSHAPEKVIFTNLSQTKDVYYWHTHYSIYHMESEKWIPVIDILAPYVIPGDYTHSIVEDTPNAQTLRRMLTQTMRFRMIDKIYLMMKVPKTPIISKTIPMFVAELLIKDAIKKGDSCSISMIPFEEISSVTVTPCYHMFNTESIEEWLKMNRDCPLCKKVIK